MAAEPVPVTGAWRDGDEVGDRKFVELAEPIELEVGGALDDVVVAYETWGALAPTRDNAVLVLHALTGDSHAAGPVGPGHPHEGWWDGLIGPGRAIDTDQWFVVSPNVLGGCQGTTGPSSFATDGRPYGSRFPVVTPRDQVAAEIGLADALGIDRWAAVIGGSMGGMRVLEWAVGVPERVASAVVIAVGAAATAEQIALASLQNEAISLDPAFRGGDYYDAAPGDGPARGMALARAIGQVSYRTETEFSDRFGNDPELEGAPLDAQRGIESYLAHHGRKLAGRFDANTYMVLSRSMNLHDVGRDRGGVGAALSRITGPTVVAAIDSDRLYPRRLQEELVSLIPTARPLEVIESIYGHDAFLLEIDQLTKIVSGALLDA